LSQECFLKQTIIYSIKHSLWDNNWLLKDKKLWKKCLQLNNLYWWVIKHVLQRFPIQNYWSLNQHCVNIVEPFLRQDLKASNIGIDSFQVKWSMTSKVTTGCKFGTGIPSAFDVFSITWCTPLLRKIAATSYLTFSESKTA
jgi:hypothetical protein